MFFGLIFGSVNLLLLPLEGINIAIDLVASIPVVTNFLTCICYVLPLSNLLPIIIIIFALILFKSVIALIRTVWSLIPFV